MKLEFSILKKLAGVSCFLIVLGKQSHSQQIIPFNYVGIYRLDTTNLKIAKDSTFLKEKKKEKLCYKKSTKAVITAQRESLLEQKDSLPKVFYFSNAQLSSSEDVVNSFAASGKIQVLAIPQRNLAFALGYNRIGIVPSSVSRDSIDLNSLLFPDAGNTGFMASVNGRFIFLKKWEGNPKQNFFRTSPYFEFSLRNTKVDITTTSTQLDTIVADSNIISNISSETEQVAFSSLNYNIGCRIEYTYVPDHHPENTFQLGLTPYLHFFNVPNEDALSFYMTLNKPVPAAGIAKTAFIHCLGGKITMSYKGLTLFGDFRSTLKTKDGIDLTDTQLSGFIFNIGTSMSVELLKL